MKSLAVITRAVLLAAIAIGILALTTPVMASAASPKTAPRGGVEGPGNLSGTGPRETVIGLLLLGSGLLVIGVAIDRAGRKSRPARP